jgi:hypothetical protein
MDLGVSIPSWLGAYRKAMDGKLAGITAGDEPAAIGYADSVVRTTQAAGAAKDLAGVQRGTQFYKLFTAFYSSMSVLFNQFQRIPQEFAQTKDVRKLVSATALVWFLPAVLEDAIRGRGPDEDDDWWAWAGRKVALYPLGTMVFLRDIASAVDRSIESGRLSGGDNAIGTISESVVKTILALRDELHGTESTRSDYRDAFTTLGYFAELPSRQLWKTLEYFYDWWTSTVDPTSPFDVFWGAVRGTPREARAR